MLKYYNYTAPICQYLFLEKPGMSPYECPNLPFSVLLGTQQQSCRG